MARRPIDAVKTASAIYSLETDQRIETLTYTGTSDFKGTGNRGDNAITGGIGNDTLDGLAGADTLTGGKGNDVYVVDDDGDVVVEKTDEGTDEVRTTLSSYSLASLADLENLTYTGTGHFHGVGNSHANVIRGGVGNDTLDGGAGNDTLIGGKGDDTYVIDSLNDVVTEAAGEGIDTIETGIVTYKSEVPGYPEYTWGQARVSLENYADVENLTYTGTEDFIDFYGTGNTLDNVIIGGPSGDVLNGGLGADTLIGGEGSDQYYIDGWHDVIVEAEDGGFDSVVLSFTTTVDLNNFYENISGVIYNGTSNFTAYGNDDNNDLIGGDGDDTIYGFGGSDFFGLNYGSDLVYGGDGDDWFMGNYGGGSSTQFGGAGNDWIWDLRGSGELWGDDTDDQAGNDTLRSVGGEDSLYGLAGNDWLEGYIGEDLLQGGRGSDSLDGGDGNDRIESANENGGDEGDVDTMHGGGGTDTFVYQARGIAIIDDYVAGETLYISFQDPLDPSAVHVAYDEATKDSTITFDGYDAALNHVVMYDFDATTLDLTVSGSDLMLA
ncbi:MAG TPA: calcium-binding protein [Aestuariivirgaceae bacterium]|nr:calcium-binding protein [Aestuariivirgaceae bacterium]